MTIGIAGNLIINLCIADELCREVVHKSNGKDLPHPGRDYHV
jgi:hypothetical protein